MMRTALTGRIAEVTLDVRYGGLRPEKTELPVPTRLVWAGLDLPVNDAELSLEHGALTLKIFDGGGHGPMEIFRRMRVLNEAARVELTDGSVVAAKLAHVPRCGAILRRDGSKCGGAEMQLVYWDWLPTAVANLLFVGRFEGLQRFPGGNLVLQQGGACSTEHLRLQGVLSWHLIHGDHERYAIASFDGAPPTAGALLGDLAALDFVAGESLDLPVMWAVDEHGATVGAIGPGRPRPITHRHRIPVPAGHQVEECWAAPLFHSLAKFTQPDESPIFTAITGYLDALRGHIHGGYLLAQVALEAFCKATLPSKASSPLVTVVADWQKWIDERARELQAFAPNPADAAILLNKLRGNVFNRPTGEVVELAFEEWRVQLPAEVIREIGKRNSVAHKFTMFDELRGDIQNAADRVDMIQMLLAAAIAKHTGYAGPIVGWERDKMGALRVPEFWQSAEIAEACHRFECSR